MRLQDELKVEKFDNTRRRVGRLLNHKKFYIEISVLQGGKSIGNKIRCEVGSVTERVVAVTGDLDLSYVIKEK